MGLNWRVALFAYLTLCFAGGFTGLFWLMNGGGVRWFGADPGSVHSYLEYAFAGNIGGTLYALRLFHQYYEKLTPRYVLWYIMRPYLCAGTAVMTIMLFESGILLLQVNDSVMAKIGVAFLAGFGYGKFMEKLALVTDALFNGKEPKGQSEPVNEEKKSG